jgi:hypothetical protein
VWTPKTELVYRLDPARFAEDLLGADLDPWQQQLLRSESQRILLNCCRQSGKSTMTAALACWQALFEPGSLVLLLSPSLRQSQELFRKTLAIYRSTGLTGERNQAQSRIGERQPGDQFAGVGVDHTRHR